MVCNKSSRSGLEVIKPEYSIRLKIKLNDCFRKQPIIALYFELSQNKAQWTRVRKQPIIALYFESENELSFITFAMKLVSKVTHSRERSGSVVERLTRDRGAAGSSLTVLCP